MRFWLFAIILAVASAGCGSEGHPAEFYPEARFLIEPFGGPAGTTFELLYIASGDARHEFDPGTTFTAAEPLGFYLDNAAPPYGASFRWISGAEADIALIVSGRTIQVSQIRLGPNNNGVPVELMSNPPPGTMLATELAQPDTRVDIVATPGTVFQGTVGDFFTSYEVGFTVDDDERLQPMAPAYIFFENPRETISAVARNANHLEITVNLYVNGNLVQSDTSSKDAVVKHDF